MDNNDMPHSEKDNLTMITCVKKYLLELQNRICSFIQEEEPVQKFHEDEWMHQEGGGGKTRILQSGKIIEKAGVNFSHVFGKNLPHVATTTRAELRGSSFQALGVSVVIHPVNPFVPTTHANVRFILV